MNFIFSGAPASYGAPSIPSYNGGGVQPSYNGGVAQPSYNGGQGGSKRPKSITIPLPDFDVGQIIREKQNIINSVVNIKKILLSPGGDVGDVGDDGGEHQEDPSLPRW